MKKLMIALAAVAMAAGVQAATCSWNTGTLQSVDKDGNWTGLPVYDTSAKTYAYSSITITSILYSDAKGENEIGRTTVTSVLPNNQASATYKVGGTGANTVVENGGTYYAKLIMEADWGNGGTQTFLVNDLTEFSVKPQGNGAVNFQTQGIVNTASETAQWSSVPEPTSGLLLLLGVAGLALRRRRA